MVRRVLPAIFALMLVITACGGGTSNSDSTDESVPAVQDEIPTELVQLTLFACNQLRGVTGESAVTVITAQVARVASAGYTASELREAMRSECPDVLEPLEEDAALSGMLEG